MKNLFFLNKEIFYFEIEKLFIDNENYIKQIIFSPEEILIGERISDGWAVYGRTLEKNIRLNQP